MQHPPQCPTWPLSEDFFPTLIRRYSNRLGVGQSPTCRDELTTSKHARTCSIASRLPVLRATKTSTGSSRDQEKAMNDREFNREWRKQRRLGQIGTNTPRCSCGVTDWRCFES